MDTPLGRRLAYLIPTDGLAVSIENIHTDLVDSDTRVEYRLKGGGQLLLYFPPDGTCIFCVGEGLDLPPSPSVFRRVVPLNVVQVPVLGPLEDEEKLVQETTLRRGIGTPPGRSAFSQLLASVSGWFPWFRPTNSANLAGDGNRTTGTHCRAQGWHLVHVLPGKSADANCIGVALVFRSGANF